MINSGKNWYTCFKCGYDLCIQCIHRFAFSKIKNTIFFEYLFRRLDKVSKKCYLCGKRFALNIWARGKHR